MALPRDELFKLVEPGTAPQSDSSEEVTFSEFLQGIAMYLVDSSNLVFQSVSHSPEWVVGMVVVVVGQDLVGMRLQCV